MSNKRLAILISLSLFSGGSGSVYGMFSGCGRCCNGEKVSENDFLFETFNGEAVSVFATKSLIPRHVDSSMTNKSVPKVEPLVSPLIPNGIEVASNGMTPIFMDLDLMIIPRRQDLSLMGDMDGWVTPESSFLCSEDVDFDDILNRALSSIKQNGVLEYSIIQALSSLQKYCIVLEDFDVIGNDYCRAQFMQKMNILKGAVHGMYCKQLQQVTPDIRTTSQSMARVQANSQTIKAVFIQVKKIECEVLLLCKCYDEIFMYDSLSMWGVLNNVINDYNLLRERFMQFKG